MVLVRIAWSTDASLAFVQTTQPILLSLAD